MSATQTPFARRPVADRPVSEGLLRHSQIGAPRVHWLAQIGVTSLKELVRRNPVRLAAQLNQLTLVEEPQPEVFTSNQILNWQEVAAQMLAGELHCQGKHVSVGIAAEIARKASESEPAVLTGLALAERIRLARTGDFQESLDQKLLQDPHPRVRRALLERKWLSAELLLLLTRDPVLAIQEAVLDHPCVDSRLLALLASHPAASVRTRVASHPLSVYATLVALARDPAACVRLAVASNPVSSLRVLMLFGQEPLAEIRMAAAQHCHASSGLFRQLLKDPCLQVRKTVAQLTPSLRQLGVLLKDESAEIRRVVAGRPLPPQLLALLAQDRDPSVRRLVAANPQTALADLKQLASDPDLGIRAAVATHPGSNHEILACLVQDAESSVKQAILSHPDLNQSLREQVLTEGLNLDIQLKLARDPRTPMVTLEWLACFTEHDAVKQDLLLRPTLSPGLIQLLLLKGLSAGVLQGLSRHPRLSASLRERLLQVAGVHSIGQAVHSRSETNLLSNLNIQVKTSS